MTHASHNLQAKTAVWVPDPENGYVEAEVVKDDGKTVSITYCKDARFKPTFIDPKTKKNPTVFKKEEVFERLPTQREPFAEMDSMGMLNQAEVLDNVHVLFQQGQSDKPGPDGTVIYSCVGPVLISMNPFKDLPVYGPEWMKAFQKCAGDKTTLRRLGPHAYRTSDDAYHHLMKQMKKKAKDPKVICNQSIVICGESGAGKTYTCRHMLKYLCETAKPETGGGADPNAITCCNELLEAFGNATTTRNDNSSRFGKLTELYFEPSPSHPSELNVCSCEVKHYLIERSRIMGAPKQERNYHIFYEMVRGGENAKYKLTDKADDYSAIKDGGGIKQPGVYESDDKSDYHALLKRMRESKFSDEQITKFLQCASVVLHLSNVKIGGDQDKSVCDAKQPGFVTACEFLGIEPAKLAIAVCEKYLEVPGQPKVQQRLPKVKAEAQLGTVARMVYSRTFDAIVQQITNTLRMKKTDNTVGLLDIFGFEDMQVNGFEQMFINLTNERIQHLFNEIMFEREKQVYRDDGLDDSFLKGPNNIECVNMFLKKGGIVPLLNEQCSMRVEDEKVDGKNFVSKMNGKFGASHKYYHVSTPQDINKLCKTKHVMSPDGRAPGLNYEDCFSIVHYAGTITYTVVDFVPKSRDNLEAHVTTIFQQSSNKFVSDMFSANKEAEASGSTVGAKFGVQLEELAQVLSSGETLFVRCIKSNPGKQQIPVLHRQSVFEQLTRGGVIAALEIRAAGLPDQVLYEDFVKEFGLLEIGDGSILKKQEHKKRSISIINNIIGEESVAAELIKFGKTKVFMKSGIIAMLRAASRFKEHLYARRVQRLLGSSRVRKIDSLWALIVEQENAAKDHNLLKYRSVTDAIEKAKGRVQPIVDKLKVAKAQHGDKNWDKLQEVMEPFMDQVKELRPLVDEVKDAVAKLEKKRQKFKNIFDQRIGNGIQNCADFERRVDSVEADAAEMEDVQDVKADVEKCKTSCKGARGKLEELRNKVLPALQAAGFDSIDLEKGESNDDPCPKVTSLLSDVEKFVVEAERLGYEVLKTKRAFMELIEQLGEAREQAQQKLESLATDAGRCEAEGMKEVTSEIKLASDLDFQLVSILDKGKDPEAFKRVFAKFAEQVEKAYAAVQEGLKELERRERERAARNAVDDQLDSTRGVINDCLKEMSLCVIKPEGYEQDVGTLESLSKDIFDLQMQGPKLELALLQSKAEACDKNVKMRTKATLEKAAKGKEAHQKNFKKAFAVFEGKK